MIGGLAAVHALRRSLHDGVAGVRADGAEPRTCVDGGEHVSHFFVHWLDLAAPLAIGGLWLWMFFTQLAQAAAACGRRSVPARGASERRRPLMAHGHRLHRTRRHRARRHEHDSADDEYSSRRRARARAHRRERLGHRQVRLLAGGFGASSSTCGIWPACSRCSSKQSEETDEQRYPLAVGAASRGCRAEPRLQQFPANELYEFRQQEDSGCTATAGWTRKPASCTFRSRRRCGWPSSAGCRRGAAIQRQPSRRRRRMDAAPTPDAGTMPRTRAPAGPWNDEGSKDMKHECSMPMPNADPCAGDVARRRVLCALGIAHRSGAQLSAAAGLPDRLHQSRHRRLQRAAGSSRRSPSAAAGRAAAARRARSRTRPGATVTLGEYFGSEQPVVLAFVYYQCPMLCTQVMNGISSSLKALPFTAGQGLRRRARQLRPARHAGGGRREEAGAPRALDSRRARPAAGTS